MKITLNNGDILSICYCEYCHKSGGKFQLIDNTNKIIYLRSGEQIAELIKNDSSNTIKKRRNIEKGG